VNCYNGILSVRLQISFIYLFFQVTKNYLLAFLVSLIEIKFITLFLVTTFRNVNICCNDYTRMLQVYLPNVSAVSSRCCMFSFGCCICCSSYTHMLQVYILTVSEVCCKCFIWMLHMLPWLYTNMLHKYVSYVSDVCCSKCFLFQVFSLASTGSERRRRRSPHACVPACIAATSIRRRAQWHV
jgi:hypothetical protein